MKKSTPVIKRTIYFKSLSEANKAYRTERHRDGKCYCTCPGFMYRRECKHVKRVVAIN